jgi:hypothetical protein
MKSIPTEVSAAIKQPECAVGDETGIKGTNHMTNFRERSAGITDAKQTYN